MNVVSATFRDRVSAETALHNLENIGIESEQVSLLMTDETRHDHFRIDESSNETARTVLSMLKTAGVTSIPGLNLVVTGPLEALLAGLGVGAVKGGVTGGLAGAGIPAQEAKIYEREIKNGGIFIAVRASGRKQKKLIKEALKTADAYNIAA